MMAASPCARNLAAFPSGSAVMLRQPSTALPNTVKEIEPSHVKHSHDEAASSRRCASVRGYIRMCGSTAEQSWAVRGARRDACSKELLGVRPSHYMHLRRLHSAVLLIGNDLANKCCVEPQFIISHLLRRRVS